MVILKINSSLWPFKVQWIVFALLFTACTESGSDQSSQRIVLEEGTNMSAAVSPDGSMIAFDASGQLWTMPFRGGRAMAITDIYGNARHASWSPDGRKLCFQAYWEGNWHIYTVSPDGENLRKITDGDFDHREPVWTEDGLGILYSADPSGSYDIYQMNLQSGKTERITRSEANEYAPSTSPNGNEIAYISDHPDERGVHVLNLNDSSDQLIYDSESTLHGVQWNQSGTGLIFVELSFGNSILRVIPSINIEADPLTVSSPDEDVFPFKASWINDEDFIYTADGKIYRRSISGQSKTEIPFSYEVVLSRAEYPERELSFSDAKNLPVKGLAWPDVSPDGQKVAIILMGDLYVLDASGQYTQLTDDSYLEMTPEWSPDQKQIAYLTDRSGRFQIIIHSLSSGEETKLHTPSGNVSGLSWSPKGNEIAFTESFGPRLGRASYVNLETGEVHAITSMMPSSLGAPCFSADGESIVFSILQPYSTLYREGVNGVMRFGLDGKNYGGIGHLPHLSFGVRGKDGPYWSSDGRHLACVSSGKLILIPMGSDGKKDGEIEVLYEHPSDSPSWTSGDEILFIDTDRLLKIDINTKDKVEFPITKTWDRVVPESQIVIHAGALFDGNSNEVISDVDIIVDGNRITEVRKHKDERDSESLFIDASGQFVMPGLIESHTHQGSGGGEKLGRSWLAWGVTSTRNPASDAYDELNRKEGMESDHLVGPRIFFTGSPIDGNRIYYGGASALRYEDQIEMELRKAKVLGYDLIKTYVRLSDSLQHQVVNRAHEMGIPVSSHELFPAVTFGVDGVEHIKGTSRRGFSPKMSHLNLAYDDVVTMIGQSGMSFTPTTGIYVSFNYLLSHDSSSLNDRRIERFVDPFYLSSIEAGISEVHSDSKMWDIHFARSMKMVKDIHDKGGLIIAGTDSPIIPFGYSLHIEMQAYAESGMSNAAVLKSATSNAAKALRLSKELGSIEKGKLADILILNKNPLDDIENTRSVDKVIVDGRLYQLRDGNVVRVKDQTGL